MSYKDEDDLVNYTDFEDELLLSDVDEPNEKTVATANVDRPTSTVTEPPHPFTPTTIDDFLVDAIGMEIVSTVDNKMQTTTLVASPDQSLLKEASPAKIAFPQNQATGGQNELRKNLKNDSKGDSDDSDNSDGRLNIKLNAERGDGNQTAATKMKFNNNRRNRYQPNRRSGDSTSRGFRKSAQNHYQLKFEPMRPLFAQTNPMMNKQQPTNQLNYAQNHPAPSQSHHQLKFEPMRPLFTQTNPMMNIQQPTNQRNNVCDGYSYQGPHNMWQQQSSNSSQSFVNRESDNFNLNINHKSPLIIQTSCTNEGNVGTRTVLKNPYFEGSKQLMQDVFNPSGMINVQNLCGPSRIDDWRGKNPVLSSGDPRMRIKNRTPASTVTESSSEDQKYLLQIEQQKLQREKCLHDKELHTFSIKICIFFIDNIFPLNFE